MADSRNTAAKILLAVERDNAYSSLALTATLRKEKFADDRDKALVTNIVYGVLERRITLDYNISLYLKNPIKKLHPAVLTILRVGAYQLLYMDRIPTSAAVNETVKLAGSFGVGFARGLINAVLRKIAAAGIQYPPKDNVIEYMSVVFSCSVALVEFFIRNYGVEKAGTLLEACFDKRPVFVRVNTLKTDAPALKTCLEEEGISVYSTKLENCLRIENTGDITALKAYKDGFFYVEDMSSQLCCRLIGAKPGDTVVDCCGAPGGKSFCTAMYMNGQGSLISCDMYEHKVNLIEEGASRLGISCIKTECCDARILPSKISEADAVLCDVPCSGFGVMGRKPEIKEKVLDDIDTLPAIQYGILSACSQMVKPGGTLIYSTCTLNPEENENNCRKFLDNFKDFTLASDEEYLSYAENGFINIIPTKDGGDGFFVAKFTRKA